jgi:hypothetical protein
MRLCSIAKLTAVLLLSLASSLLLLALPMGAQTPTKQDPYLDPRLPTAQRVDDLVKRMTLAEKIAQMQSEAPSDPTPSYRRLRLVERRPAWRGTYRLCNSFSAGDRSCGDPFLTGEIGSAFVRGLQGTDPGFLKKVATVSSNVHGFPFLEVSP